MPTSRQLVLYYFTECPYCQRVLQVIRDHQISGIETRNIRENPVNKETLIQIGGKSQVPCLVIDGVPLYESNDIINWLKKEWVS
ncbi:glutaredoxin [bacterium]|nr:glutaredoxin [bacterium]